MPIIQFITALQTASQTTIYNKTFFFPELQNRVNGFINKIDDEKDGNVKLSE